MLGVVELREFPPVGLRLGLPLVGAEAVVEVVQHFRFVQWQVALFAAMKDVPVQPPAACLELVTCSE
jgi:hypothetical protein